MVYSAGENLRHVINTYNGLVKTCNVYENRERKGIKGS